MTSQSPEPSPARAAGEDNRKWWWIGVPLVVLASALMVWFGLAMSVGKATWATYGYKVLDDREVRVHFDVTRPPGMSLVCTVTALATDFGVVGSVDVPVPAAADEQTRVTTVVRTTSRAVTGTVRTCREA